MHALNQTVVVEGEQSSRNRQHDTTEILSEIRHKHEAINVSSADGESDPRRRPGRPERLALRRGVYMTNLGASKTACASRPTLAGSATETTRPGPSLSAKARSWSTCPASTRPATPPKTPARRSRPSRSIARPLPSSKPSNTTLSSGPCFSSISTLKKLSSVWSRSEGLQASSVA